jgi:hypothetical protein
MDLYIGNREAKDRDFDGTIDELQFLKMRETLNGLIPVIATRTILARSIPSDLKNNLNQNHLYYTKHLRKEQQISLLASLN